MSADMITEFAGIVERIGLDVGLVLGIIGITWLVKKNIPQVKAWVVFIPLILGVVAAFAATPILVEGKIQVAALTKSIFAYAGGASILYNLWETVRRRGRNGQ